MWPLSEEVVFCVDRSVSWIVLSPPALARWLFGSGVNVQMSDVCIPFKVSFNSYGLLSASVSDSIVE